MLVSELVQKLLAVPQHLPVTISDGFKCNFYNGEYDVLEYLDGDNVQMVDIGIGGTDEEIA